jgi:small subunit ribosomal protein S20
LNVAHSLSSKKRIRQNEKRRVANRARKSRIKTQRRKFSEALTVGDLEKAGTELRQVFKLVDQVARKKTIHKNAANRIKSRLQKRLNRASASKA